ncbi:MAG: adenylate kinase [Actinomycetes bacterium]
MAPRLIVVLLGKQGAGKGTQCASLSEQYNIPHVSTGDILRTAVREGTPLGLQVKSVLDAGDLVSDDLVVALVKERFAQPDAQSGALLDGFPRTIGQATALDAMLADESVSICINLDVPTALVVERLSRRRVCQECGAIYRADEPAGASGTCEKCGGDVIQRADDQPEAIQQRLDAYERDTAPLLDYYAAKDLVVTVDGDQTVAAVGAAVSKALAGRGLV